MLRKVLLLGFVALLIVVAASSTAYAQADGDKFVLGEDFVLRSGEVLGGNLAVLGGTATLEQGSTVKGDVAVAGGQLIVAGTVEGSAAVFGGTAVLEETAVVEGDFASFGGTVERAPGAVIEGESFSGLQPRIAPPAPFEAPQLPETPFPVLPSQRSFQGLGELISWQFVTLGSALMMILLGVVAVSVAPRPMSRIASAAAAQPALCFGAGLLTFVVGILAGALLLIACCLGLFVWLALAVAMIVGWIAVGLWAGQRLLAALKVRGTSALVEVALGVFLITIVGRLPWCIGSLFSLVVGSIGLGAVVLTRFGRQPATNHGGEPSGSPRQSFADLDAEVLAPLAPPPPAPFSVEPESTVPLEPSTSGPGSSANAALEPGVAIPALPETTADSSRAAPTTAVDASLPSGEIDAQPGDREADQPET